MLQMESCHTWFDNVSLTKNHLKFTLVLTKKRLAFIHVDVYPNNHFLAAMLLENRNIQPANMPG